MEAIRAEEGIVLRWQTGYEVDNVGFHVYREEDGRRERLTHEPILGSLLRAGSGTPLTAGGSYSWLDSEGDPWSLKFIGFPISMYYYVDIHT
jgi:hypothetical protein